MIKIKNSPYKAVWQMPESKKYLLLEIDTMTKSSLFRVEYFLDRSFHQIITSLSQCLNEVTHLFITSLLKLLLSIK